jgi:hypothetical protein
MTHNSDYSYEYTIELFDTTEAEYDDALEAIPLEISDCSHDGCNSIIWTASDYSFVYVKDLAIAIVKKIGRPVRMSITETSFQPQSAVFKYDEGDFDIPKTTNERFERMGSV